MAEVGSRVVADIALQLLPAAVRVLDPLALGTDGQYANDADIAIYLRSSAPVFMGIRRTDWEKLGLDVPPPWSFDRIGPISPFGRGSAGADRHDISVKVPLVPNSAAAGG